MTQTRRDAVANGQFILIKRSIYDLIGGHERVKDQIVEDKAISEQVKWNGHRLIVADGMQVVQHAYVHIPCEHVGRLDEEYLSRLARSSSDVIAWRIWRNTGVDRRAIPARLASAWAGIGISNGGGWMAVGRTH